MVHDLYILMITAGIVALLFKLLKQPVVLGYIVAGILVGPHLFGEKLVEMENVETFLKECGQNLVFFYEELWAGKQNKFHSVLCVVIRSAKVRKSEHSTK